MKRGNALLKVKTQGPGPGPVQVQAQAQGQGPVIVEADQKKRGLLTDQRVGSSTRTGVVSDAGVDSGWMGMGVGGCGWMGRPPSYGLLLMRPWERGPGCALEGVVVVCCALGGKYGGELEVSNSPPKRRSNGRAK